MTELSHLPQLATAANQAHQQFERLAGEALDYARYAGVQLTEAKAKLPHGQFEGWLESHISFSARTARSYMRVAANWPAIESKRSEFPNLTLRDAIESLATPRTEPVENGNALPFCLPPPGRMLVGRFGTYSDCVVIEPYPPDDRYVRIAIAIGSELTFLKRGIIRSWAGEILHHCGVNLETVEWLPERPATRENNPFGHVLPEWEYAA